MTIEITTPEVEDLIHRRLQNGHFKDAEDVLLQALRLLPDDSSHAANVNAVHEKSFSELFAPLRGLDIDFERNATVSRS
jgi:Arc/MetJ-type ribon-helix-helix transcriptional regulator